MPIRLLKQLLYGSLYLAIFSGLIWLVYSLEFKAAPSCFDNDRNGDETGIDCGGSCISCEIKNLQMLSVGNTILFEADRDFSAVASIRNPNDIFGVNFFDYEAIFYDKSGTALKSVRGTGFIYPGQEKNIIEAGAKITEGIPSRAEIKLLNENDIKWLRKEDFSEPEYGLREISSYLENGQVVVSGFVENVKNFTYSRIIVSAFALDNLGTRMGAGKSEIKNLNKFGAANFKIFIPVKKDYADLVDFAGTKKTVSVEILK